MKIIFEKYRMQSIKGGFGVVSFDKNGETEVSEETGKRLIEMGAYEAGKKPIAVAKTEIKSEEIKDEKALQRITELEHEVLVAKQNVESLKDKLRVSEDSVESWKKEYEKAVAGELTEEEIKENTSIENIKIGENDIAVVVDLNAKGMQDLIDICKGLELPEADYIALKKRDLVIYIAKKTLCGKG